MKRVLLLSWCVTANKQGLKVEAEAVLSWSAASAGVTLGADAWSLQLLLAQWICSTVAFLFLLPVLLHSVSDQGKVKQVTFLEVNLFPELIIPFEYLWHLQKSHSLQHWSGNMQWGRLGTGEAATLSSDIATYVLTFWDYTAGWGPLLAQLRKRTSPGEHRKEKGFVLSNRDWTEITLVKQKSKYEPAVCACSLEGQLYPGCIKTGVVEKQGRGLSPSALLLWGLIRSIVSRPPGPCICLDPTGDAGNRAAFTAAGSSSLWSRGWYASYTSAEKHIPPCYHGIYWMLSTVQLRMFSSMQNTTAVCSLPALCPLGLGSSADFNGDSQPVE